MTTSTQPMDGYSIKPYSLQNRQFKNVQALFNTLNNINPNTEKYSDRPTIKTALLHAKLEPVQHNQEKHTDFLSR